MSMSCKDGGVLPTTGFPRVGGMAKSDNSDTVQTYRTSHTCKGISSRSVISVVIPSKRAFRGGSKTSREVVVHVATVVEVDVHGISAGRRVAVHVRSGTWRIHVVGVPVL